MRNESEFTAYEASPQAELDKQIAIEIVARTADGEEEITRITIHEAIHGDIFMGDSGDPRCEALLERCRALQIGESFMEPEIDNDEWIETYTRVAGG
jgi:hypothetical protein